MDVYPIFKIRVIRDEVRGSGRVGVGEAVDREKRGRRLQCTTCMIRFGEDRRRLPLACTIHSLEQHRQGEEHYRYSSTVQTPKAGWRESVIELLMGALPGFKHQSVALLRECSLTCLVRHKLVQGA